MLQLLRASVLFASTLLVLDVQAGSSGPSDKPAEAARQSTSAAGHSKSQAAMLAAADAARRDADPVLNGTARDWPPSNSSVAKR